MEIEDPSSQTVSICLQANVQPNIQSVQPNVSGLGSITIPCLPTAHPEVAVGVPVSMDHVAASHAMAGRLTPGHLGPFQAPVSGQVAIQVAPPNQETPMALLMGHLTGLQPAGDDMERALETVLASWEPCTRDDLRRVYQLFKEAMVTLAPGRDTNLWQHATPEHILLFIDSWAYTGGKTPRLSKKKCHGTISNILSHLNTLFECAGKSRPWNPETNSGNPVKSFLVARYKKGYGKQTAREGHRSKGAKPWDYDILGQLLTKLDAALLQPQSWLSVFCMTRDATALCLSGHMGSRAHDVGYIWMEDFQPVSRGAMPVYPTSFHPNEGDVYEMRLFSKTRKLYPGSPISLTYSQERGQRECNFLWRLEQFWGQLPPMHALGNYMFGRDKKPLTSDCLNTRLKGYFSEYALGPPKTVHGLRRGLAQGLEADGFTQTAIMEHMDIKSARSYRLYSDPNRHQALPCPGSADGVV